MKTMTVIFLALLLLIAAVVIFVPMLMAQPPDGVVAQPSMTLLPFAIGIVALGVLSWISMRIFSSGAVNATEVKLDAADSTESNPSGESVLDRLAPTVCWIGVFLSGLLIFATLVASVISLSPGHDEGGRGMAIGIVYFMVIPAAAILAGLFCLAGGLMCKKAMRCKTSHAHQTALRFATRIPLVGMMWWIVGVVFIVGFGQ